MGAEAKFYTQAKQMTDSWSADGHTCQLGRQGQINTQKQQQESKNNIKIGRKHKANTPASSIKQEGRSTRHESALAPGNGSHGAQSNVARTRMIYDMMELTASIFRRCKIEGPWWRMLFWSTRQALACFNTFLSIINSFHKSTSFTTHRKTAIESAVHKAITQNRMKCFTTHWFLISSYQRWACGISVIWRSLWRNNHRVSGLENMFVVEMISLSARSYCRPTRVRRIWQGKWEAMTHS